MKRLLIATLALTTAGAAHANGMAGADPILFKGMLNHLEQTHTDGDKATHWDVEAWLGKDIDKLWFKSDGERHDGATEHHRLQLLYNRAISAYWDAQIGVAHDTEESPSDHWLAMALRGTAPYFIDTEAELYLGKQGYHSLQLKFGQEWMFTQRLALEPELELIANNRKSMAHNLGSGVSKGKFNLRLHYEITRKFAPYIGASWDHRYGDTATLGGDKEISSWMIGVSGWF